MISNNPPDNSRLADLDLIFNPLAHGGWNVTPAFSSPTAVSSDSAAPEPATLVDTKLSAFVFFALRRRNRTSVRR
jgi:hypothetical protein